MKTVMVMKWDGVTADQYEKLRKSVNWEGDVPKGALFHVAGFSNNAIRVTDIWESADDFNNFVQNRLMPGTATVGIKGEPQVEMFPVHAIFVPAPGILA
jgi:hypothetical protein